MADRSIVYNCLCIPIPIYAVYSIQTGVCHVLTEVHVHWYLCIAGIFVYYERGSPFLRIALTHYVCTPERCLI